MRTKSRGMKCQPKAKNQLQVFIVEVLCLRSQLEDMLCNSTFSNIYIYPWELSPIATAKIGASWKTPVGYKGGDIWIEHNTIDSFSNFPWYGDTEFLL